MNSGYNKHWGKIPCLLWLWFTFGTANLKKLGKYIIYIIYVINTKIIIMKTKIGNSKTSNNFSALFEYNMPLCTMKAYS